MISEILKLILILSIFLSSAYILITVVAIRI